MRCSLDPGAENCKLPSNLDIPSSGAAASVRLVVLSEPGLPKGAHPVERSSVLPWRRDSVQRFVLTLFSNQLLEIRHNLVASRHDLFHFTLGEIVLGFFCQRVPV